MAGGSQEADDEARAEGREPGVPATRPDTGTVVHEDYGNGETPTAPAFARQPEVVFVAVVCAVATIALGVYPGPLFDVAQDAGNAFKSLL